jgi:gas vesicle protein
MPNLQENSKMKTNFRKNIFNMSGKQLQKLASRLQKKYNGRTETTDREYTPIEVLTHDKLIPVARKVVAEFRVEGSTWRTTKNGDKYPWIQIGTLAEEIVRKLTHIRYSPKGNNARKSHEAIWIIQFLTDDSISTKWETVKNPKGFKFDPITGLGTDAFEVTRPEVSNEMRELFMRNGIFLNTITLVKTFFQEVIEELTEDELNLYLDYINGDQEKTEGETHIIQTESPEVPKEVPEESEELVEETESVTDEPEGSSSDSNEIKS